jgi:hypothetical protein
MEIEQMGEEADADWDAGLVQWGASDARRDRRDFSACNSRCKWSEWKIIGRTGDWFKPLIVERKCKTCGTTETDEH